MKTFCSYYNLGVCKSCDMITMDYSDQLIWKESRLKEALKNCGDFNLLPSVKSESLHFRNKAKLVVTGTLAEPVIGLWGETNLDVGRELLECEIHLKEINQLLPTIKEFIKLAKLEPYQIAAKKGELKGLIIFHSPATNESYLRFVLRSKESIDRIRKNLNFLTSRHPELQCVSVNIQPVAHAVLEGEEEIFITEKTSILQKAGDVTFSLSPRAFVQTNQVMAEKLYRTAAEWIKEQPEKKFMELFCGQGAFSFFCAPYIEEGLGIEINPEAIKEANLTAKKFKITHLQFRSADAAKVGDEILKFDPGILLVNPPRRGMAEAVKLIQKYRPEIFIYSSCNAETLGKDLEQLPDYKIKRAQIFDMFPHTSHFETLVELRLNEND